MAMLSVVSLVLSSSPLLLFSVHLCVYELWAWLVATLWSLLIAAPLSQLPSLHPCFQSNDPASHISSPALLPFLTGSLFWLCSPTICHSSSLHPIWTIDFCVDHISRLDFAWYFDTNLQVIIVSCDCSFSACMSVKRHGCKLQFKWCKDKQP